MAVKKRLQSSIAKGTGNNTNVTTQAKAVSPEDNRGNFTDEWGNPTPTNEEKPKAPVELDDATETLKQGENEDALKNQDKLGKGVVDRSRRDDTYFHPSAGLNLSREQYGGNINEQDFDTTLRYSRMADMLNNRMHLTPSSIGARTATRGSSGTGIDQIGIGMQKGPQVETEETRQMRMNEQLAAQQRQQDIARQGNIWSRTLEIQKGLDQNMVAMASKIGMDGMELANLIAKLQIQKEYGEEYDQILRMIYDDFGNKLRYHYNAEVADFLNRHKEDFIHASMMGQQVGVTLPSRFTQMIDGIINSEMADAGSFSNMNTQEKKNFVTYMCQLLTSMAFDVLYAVAPEMANGIMGVGGTQTLSNKHEQIKGEQNAANRNK